MVVLRYNRKERMLKHGRPPARSMRFPQESGRRGAERKSPDRTRRCAGPPGCRRRAGRSRSGPRFRSRRSPRRSSAARSARSRFCRTRRRRRAPLPLQARHRCTGRAFRLSSRTAAVQPHAAAIPAVRASSRAFACARVRAENVRIVPSRIQRSGMTLLQVPA